MQTTDPICPRYRIRTAHYLVHYLTKVSHLCHDCHLIHYFSSVGTLMYCFRCSSRISHRTLRNLQACKAAKLVIIDSIKHPGDRVVAYVNSRDHFKRRISSEPRSCDTNHILGANKSTTQRQAVRGLWPQQVASQGNE